MIRQYPRCEGSLKEQRRGLANPQPACFCVQDLLACNALELGVAGNRSLPMDERGPAPSGRNQLQAFVFGLTDTQAPDRANIAKLPVLLPTEGDMTVDPPCNTTMALARRGTVGPYGVGRLPNNVLRKGPRKN